MRVSGRGIRSRICRIANVLQLLKKKDGRKEHLGYFENFISRIFFWSSLHYVKHLMRSFFFFLFLFCQFLYQSVLGKYYFQICWLFFLTFWPTFRNPDLVDTLKSSFLWFRHQVPSSEWWILLRHGLLASHKKAAFYRYFPYETNFWTITRVLCFLETEVCVRRLESVYEFGFPFEPTIFQIIQNNRSTDLPSNNLLSWLVEILKTLHLEPTSKNYVILT